MISFSTFWGSEWVSLFTSELSIFGAAGVCISTENVTGVVQVKIFMAHAWCNV